MCCSDQGQAKQELSVTPCPRRKWAHIASRFWVRKFVQKLGFNAAYLWGLPSRFSFCMFRLSAVARPVTIEKHPQKHFGLLGSSRQLCPNDSTTYSSNYLETAAPPPPPQYNVDCVTCVANLWFLRSVFLRASRLQHCIEGGGGKSSVSG